MELEKILEAHNKWAKTEGTEGKRADLRNTNLRCANLSGADLRCADLSGADLRNTNLYGTNLDNADLRCADLDNANLSGADLRNTNLYGTNLDNADLSGADLDKKEQYRLGTILSKKIIGYKKCKNNVIVKLEIPKGATVFCINGNKCRTNKAKVLEIIGADNAVSKYDENFIYKTGKKYEIKNFNLMYNVECGTGIHFFKTKKEAKEYQI